METTYLGIDIGGTGIKGAPVDMRTGKLLAPRYRLLTPHPSRPEAVAGTVVEICRHFDWQGPLGFGFPGVVRGGTVLTAPNLHKSWQNQDSTRLFSDHTGLPATILNDADAAGLAEMQFGTGKDRQGVVIVITIGTGLGSALFVNGTLVPNTELGHLEIDGHDAEKRASDLARKKHSLSWKRWAARFNHFLRVIERLFSPDLIILGGGAVKKYDKFEPYLKSQAELVPAQLANEAGIVGAAWAAYLYQEVSNG